MSPDSPPLPGPLPQGRGSGQCPATGLVHHSSLSKNNKSSHHAGRSPLPGERVRERAKTYPRTHPISPDVPPLPCPLPQGRGSGQCHATELVHHSSLSKNNKSTHHAGRSPLPGERVRERAKTYPRTHPISPDVPPLPQGRGSGQCPATGLVHHSSLSKNNISSHHAGRSPLPGERVRERAKTYPRTQSISPDVPPLPRGKGSGQCPATGLVHHSSLSKNNKSRHHAGRSPLPGERVRERAKGRAPKASLLAVFLQQCLGDSLRLRIRDAVP